MMNVSKDIPRKGKAAVKASRCEGGGCCNASGELLRMEAVGVLAEKTPELGELIGHMQSTGNTPNHTYF